MAVPSQTNRPIALLEVGANASPADASLPRLALRAISAYEEMSRPFCYELDLLGDISDDQIAGAYVGKQVTIRLGREDQSPRYVNGYVARFARAGTCSAPNGTQYFRYRATVVPFLWLLSRRRNCKIFRADSNDPSVMGVVKVVLGGYKFDDFLDDGVTASSDVKTYFLPEYTTQYEETDLDFISRLLEHYGLYYYFTHEETYHRLVISDTPTSYLPIDFDSLDSETAFGSELTDIGTSASTGGTGQGSLPPYPVIAPGPAVGTFPPVDFSTQPSAAPNSSGGTPGARVWDWREELQFMPRSFTVGDFKSCDASPSSQTSDRITESPISTDVEWYEFGEAFTDLSLADEEIADAGKALARTRSERGECAATIASGVSDCHRASAGRTFTRVTSSGSSNQYLVTRIDLQACSDLFETGAAGADLLVCGLRAIPWTSDGPPIFRPERITARPKISGPHSAVVVTAADSSNTIDVDRWGRVLVQFHWEREGQASRRVRVSQIWAGGSTRDQGGDSAWGSMHIPHVGDEVLVEFICGDPDRPVVTGRIYTEGITSPVPRDLSSRTIADDYLPANKTRSLIKDIGGNYLMMEEGLDLQQIEMYSPKSGTAGITARLALGDSKNGWRYQDSQSGGNGIGGSGDYMDSALDGINARSTGHAVIAVDQSCSVYSGGDFRHSVVSNHFLRVEGNSETAYNGSRSQLTWTNSSEMTLGTTAELFIGFTTSLTIAGSFDATLGVAIEVGMGVTASAFLGMQGEVFYGYSYGRSYAIKNEEDYTLKLKKAANEIEETVTKMVTAGLLTINNGALTVLGPPPAVVPAPSTPPSVPPPAAPAAAAPAAATPAAAPAAIAAPGAAAPAAVAAPIALAG